MQIKDGDFMKSFIKKKVKSPSPGFRTADYFKGRIFRGSRPQTRPGFDPAKFKIQHKS